MYTSVMTETPKKKAGRQLAFAVMLLLVSVAGYLVTKSYAPTHEIIAPDQNTSSSVVLPGDVAPTSTPVTPKTTAPVIKPGEGEQVFEGMYVCLPHRDTGGAQTMECALGMQTDDGKYYAINATNAGSESKVGITPTGVRIRLVGTLTGASAIADATWQKYDIAGMVNARSFSQL